MTSGNFAPEEYPDGGANEAPQMNPTPLAEQLSPVFTCATGTVTMTWPCRSEARWLTTDTATGTQLPAGTLTA